ncbi:MAG: hypothetical protein P1U38_09620 [Aeromicrobium sp.]|uniref:hypothetical protein n=1 Tax=Aeromicrobium sp. TaxID=1871063 RepID=UPI002621B674|nr:hypothetical protein [Aeromicrobium sp.]MDF1705019.1 hypothetical protein [Aeromicrobium sp.]
MAYATVTDVATRLGRPFKGQTESDQWTAWLEDIEAIINGRFNLESAIAAGKPTEAVVKMVEANAVIRKINNPTGKRSERIDDYYYDYGERGSSEGLYLNDDEWALIAPNGSPDGAFTIRPYGTERGPGDWVHPDVWVPLP